VATLVPGGESVAALLRIPADLHLAAHTRVCCQLVPNPHGSHLTRDGILGHHLTKDSSLLIHAIHSPFYLRILKKTNSIQRVYAHAKSFFGAEIQSKHLVFYNLGFLPGFLLVFCFLPDPPHSRFIENQAFLFWRIFSLGFLNPNNCLAFLDLFTC
jgi:hypothetical protein